MKKLIATIAARFGYVPAPARRDYAAARIDRLTAAWKASAMSADSTIRYALPVLRGRSRDLAENNDYIAGYLELLANKVVGDKGISLQVKARGGDGKLDRAANAAIEKAWQLWARKGSCDITGRLSWVELQRLCLVSMARDGEVFIRLIRQPGVSQFHLALQVIEADMVDVTKNDTLANGNTIRMGVEITPFDRPVAYHVLERHPGDLDFGRLGGRTVRIQAEEMLHLYRQLRPGQTRGVPWTASVMTRLNHIGAYEEAAIINARFGASKMGFFTRKPEASGDLPLPSDAAGNLISEVEPGQLETLPLGYDFTPFDPAYPSGEYDPFIKRQIKGASCGLPGASYAELSNDLESVSFSSIRSGTINSRDSYRAIQQLLVEQLCQPVYEAWLTVALAFGLITVANGLPGPNPRLSVASFDKYNAPLFKGRGWEWVDPLKDELANTEALKNRLTSRTRIAVQKGDDLEDLLAEWAQEQELAQDYNVTMPDPAAPAAALQPEEEVQ